MKLKLKSAGYENFTGLFGMVEFVNGVSVSDVNPNIAKRVACILSVEWEDGTKPGVADALLNNANMPAPTKSETAPFVESSVVAPAKVWTEEELGTLADKEGIAGVRAVADTVGIKGNSIVSLIKAIVEKGVTKED